MSFIRNIEIWKNQVPRVCNFDLQDYCNFGNIGNTCTENTGIPNTEDAFSTARATYDAWIKAVNEYVLASLSFYYEIGYDNPSIGINIPEDALNLNCNSQENFNAICDLYYNASGFVLMSIDFEIKRLQLENSLLLDSNPDKKTGVYSYTKTIPTSPTTTAPYTYSVDYTNYQTPSIDIYLEYRESLGIMLRQLKKIITATSNSSLSSFDIP